jgi:hypothetical protein
MIPPLLPDGWWRFKNSGLPTARWLVLRFQTLWCGEVELAIVAPSNHLLC